MAAAWLAVAVLLLAATSTSPGPAMAAPLAPQSSAGLPQFGCAAPVFLVLDVYGFGADVRLLLGRVLAALAARRDPVILERGWSYGCEPGRSWGCYFETPRGACAGTPPDGRATDMRWKQAWRDALAGNERVALALGLPRAAGPLAVAREALSRLWLPTPATHGEVGARRAGLPLGRPYIAVHLRRGDKLRELPGRRYLSVADQVGIIEQFCEAHGVRYDWVFLMSDDHATVAEVQAAASHPVHTLVAEGAVGFNVCATPFRRKHDKRCRCGGPGGNPDPTMCFHNPGAEEPIPLQTMNIVDDTYALLTDVHVAAAARYFFGDCESNVGHFIQLRRTQPATTARCVRDTGRFFEGYSLSKAGFRETTPHVLYHGAPTAVSAPGAMGTAAAAVAGGPRVRLVFLAGLVGAGHIVWHRALTALEAVGFDLNLSLAIQALFSSTEGELEASCASVAEDLKALVAANSWTHLVVNGPPGAWMTYPRISGAPADREHISQPEYLQVLRLLARISDVQLSVMVLVEDPGNTIASIVSRATPAPGPAAQRLVTAWAGHLSSAIESLAHQVASVGEAAEMRAFPHDALIDDIGGAVADAVRFLRLARNEQLPNLAASLQKALVASGWTRKSRAWQEPFRRHGLDPGLVRALLVQASTHPVFGDLQPA